MFLTSSPLDHIVVNHSVLTKCLSQESLSGLSCCSTSWALRCCRLTDFIGIFSFFNRVLRNNLIQCPVSVFKSNLLAWAGYL